MRETLHRLTALEGIEVFPSASRNPHLPENLKRRPAQFELVLVSDQHIALC
jgi:hypothetical protein